ncbi:hypothetical protein ABI125_03195 [Tamlana crocina]
MNFIETLLWLETYKGKKSFTLIELNSGEKFEVEQKENVDCFVFPIHVTSPLYKKIYSEESRFAISSEKIIIKVKNYTIDWSSDFLVRDLRVYMFESDNFDRNKNCFYRLLCPIKSSFYVINLNHAHTDEFNLNLKKANIHIYSTDSDNERYLVVESKSELNYTEFIHYANSILFTLGFLSGNLIKGEELIFQSEDASWNLCDGFFRRKLKKVSKCYQPITSTPTQYSNFITNKDYDFESKASYLEPEKIGDLIDLLAANGNYFVAIKLLLEIGDISFVNRPSTLYVVLEIIVDEIVKNGSKPFVEKVLIKQKSLDLLSKYKSKIEDRDYKELQNAINEIDKKLAQNNKKYEEAFKVFDLELNLEDKRCLNKRNQFFHGRVVPRNILIKNEDNYVELELEYYSLTQRLFTLISKLILKKVKFNGYVINHSKMRENQSNRVFDEEYFVKI